MNKAILIIDMPDSCDSCPLFGNHYSDLCCKALNNRSIDYPYPKEFKQEWCPLSVVPKKKAISQLTQDELEERYEQGYNDCIDDILGQ